MLAVDEVWQFGVRVSGDASGELLRRPATPKRSYRPRAAGIGGGYAEGIRRCINCSMSAIEAVEAHKLENGLLLPISS